jgi:hypothetical protein
MKRICILLFSLFIMSAVSGAEKISIDSATKPITRDSLALMPVPGDSKNYFILQSIGNNTNVVIGDFSGAEKVICLISDRNSDGTVDDIYEYYPDSRKGTTVAKPTSRLYTGYPQIKRDIIEGKVFKDSSRTGGSEYTHEMISLPVILAKIKEGRFITRRGSDGWYVRYTDPDLKDTTMADFFFGKEQGLNSLQFRTLYYKNGGVKIEPTIVYSVYCRSSKDYVVAEYVDMLLKLAKERKL